MLGSYDFCGHYEWTFEWLHRLGGQALVYAYWEQAIGDDSQNHATELIFRKGIAGMEEYWGHSLKQEGAGYHTTSTEAVFRIDMHACPSKGFLLRNGLQQYGDYCDHCIGWIGPMMKKAGFAIDHEHNHGGQCWWEMRRTDDTTPMSEVGEVAGDEDVRKGESWNQSRPLDAFFRSHGPGEKLE